MTLPIPQLTAPSRGSNFEGGHSSDPVMADQLGGSFKATWLAKKAHLTKVPPGLAFQEWTTILLGCSTIVGYHHGYKPTNPGYTSYTHGCNLLSG